MTALTPDCDPDLSNCGSPTSGGGVRSSLVLLVLVAVATLAVTGGAVAGPMAFLAGGVGLLSALVLARRMVRLAGQAGAALAARGPWTAAPRRSRPVG